jgi:hypothetical protein
MFAVANERQDRTRAQWTHTAESLRPDARGLLSLFESLNNDEFQTRLERLPKLRKRLDDLSPSLHIEGLRAPLIIIHIRTDPCVSSEESFKLARAASAHRVFYSLTVLNLFGHAQPEWPPISLPNLFGFYIPESWRLVRVLHNIRSYA